MRGSYRLIAFLTYRQHRERKVDPWVTIRAQHMKDPAWVRKLDTWREQLRNHVLTHPVTVQPQPQVVVPAPVVVQPRGWYFYADGKLYDGFPTLYDAQEQLVACANAGAHEISDIQEA